MLIRPFKSFSPLTQSISKRPSSIFLPLSSQSFSAKETDSKWRPIVPKFKVRLDRKSFYMAHPIWDQQDVENVELVHRPPKDLRDRAALTIIKTLRKFFDLASGYKPGNCTETGYLRRFLFLEIIAGVPGMIGGMMRHMRSLATMKRDHGWIHHLLEEAENERMHLFTFLDMRQPGLLFRIGILGAQSIFILAYTTMYFLSAKSAHRFVGYLEEEAVKTYSLCLKELDEGTLPKWKNMDAPEIAKTYWDLGPDAKLRDVILAVRADEIMHREMNHHFADLRADAPAEKWDIEVTGEIKKHGHSH